MKFSEKYPNLRPGQVVSGIMRAYHSDNCKECGKMTSFIDLYTEAFFCSDECLEKFYHDYHSANKAIVGDLPESI